MSIQTVASPTGDRGVVSDDALWAAYRNDRSLANRNALVEAHLGLVGAVVRSTAPSRLWSECEASGVVGLIQAVERFDPAVGVKFSYGKQLISIDWLGPAAAEAA